MKKPLAIILAFFIVFSPVYSYAVLPALIASAASAAGRVLVGNGVKKVSQTALSRGGFSLFSICKGSQAIGCLGAAATIYDALRDKGYTIEEGDTINNNINIEIYKLPPNDECELEIRWGDDKVTSYSLYNEFKSSRLNGRDHPDGSSLLIASELQQLEVFRDYKSIEWKAASIVRYYIYYDYRDSSDKPYIERSTSRSTQSFLRCVPYPTNKIYLTENEFYNYLQQNITADDIKNIYNYDYSQHPNITINNNSYGGNTINNDLSVSAEPEFKVSPSLKLDIESNKVNLDNVNDENCTKNEAGEYDKCGDTEEPTDPENPDPDTPVPPEPSPIECDANGFYKKVCDWMNWTQKPHTEPTTTNVVVVDKTSDIVIDDSRINFDDQCPMPKDINIVVSGHSASDALDYQPMCDFFTKLKPFVIGLLGAIPSAMIIVGGARRG